MAMLSHAPTPEPEPTHGELHHHELFDAGADDAGTDDASNGYIVFSLGPDLAESTLDVYGDMAPARRTA
jgi:hypothetical protein